MFRFTHERVRLVEIARQRRAEQARLAKLEEQRVEYLDRKLAQAEQRDRLRTFLMTLPPDSISEEASVRSITGRYGTRAPSVEQAVQAFARQQGEIVVPSGAAAAKSLQPAVVAQHQADRAEQGIVLRVLANDYPRAQCGRDIAGLDERVAFI